MSTSKSPSITKMVKYRMIRMRSKSGFLQYNARNKLIRGSSTRSWEAVLLSLISDHCTRSLQDTSRATIHFILATKTGFAARSNLFRDCLAQFAPVIQFVDLSVFGKRYRARSLNDSLENLLSHALCVFTSDPSKAEADLSQLPNIEPSINTSMGLILDTMPQRKTIALIHGRDDFFAAQPILNTADDLGIDLVILDRAGHWLLDSKYTHLYKEFEPLDMTIDEDFPARIVTAIKRHKVDGVCTVSDRCLLPVSKAASILGLPTELPESYARSIDKSQTRLLNCEHVDFLSISGATELKQRIDSGSFVPRYPLIAKPSVGWSSEHVFKVQNKTELLLAAERIAARPNAKVLIETYVDGPEVDANFVLCDGEILFFEISDDFPSPADSLRAGMEADFFETANVLPSALPQEEQDVIRNSLHKILLHVGFQTGVFHLEARVINSRLEYANKNGVFDLAEKPNLEEGIPSCFLIEINPRPPGFQSVHATQLMYRVDYFALHLLRSVGDKERFRIFAEGSGGSLIQNPQRDGSYWSSIVFITGGKGGVCTTVDACADLIKRAPHLKENIAMGTSFFKHGDVIPQATPERLVFLGFFLVASRVSRSRVRRAADEIRENFRLAVDL